MADGERGAAARRRYSAVPHSNRATASLTSWSRVGSSMVTTMRATGPGSPDPTSTLPETSVAPVLMPSPQGKSSSRLWFSTGTAASGG